MIAALLVALSSPPPALISPNTEVATALSAAPPQLRSGAGVFVLKSSGFVRVRESRNGFNCLVERGHNSIGPVCYDAEGSRTTLRASLEEARLTALGIDVARVNTMIDAEYRTGRLQAPKEGGVAYMLSDRFLRVNPQTGRVTHIYPPHVMIYAPYARNADLGIPAGDVRSVSHIWVEAEGRPDACVVVPWSIANGFIESSKAGRSL